MILQTFIEQANSSHVQNFVKVTSHLVQGHHYKAIDDEEAATRMAQIALSEKVFQTFEDVKSLR